MKKFVLCGCLVVATMLGLTTLKPADGVIPPVLNCFTQVSHP